MRYKMYTFLGGWYAPEHGKAIQRYFPSKSENITIINRDPLDIYRGKYIALYKLYLIRADEQRIMLVPETSGLFNYDFIQNISQIRFLARPNRLILSYLLDLDYDINQYMKSNI